MNEHPKTEAELQVVLLHKEINAVKDELEELRADVKDLVAAWKTANGVVAFVKWIAGLGTALSALWLFVRMRGDL